MPDNQPLNPYEPPRPPDATQGDDFASLVSADGSLTFSFERSHQEMIATYVGLRLDAAEKDNSLRFYRYLVPICIIGVFSFPWWMSEPGSRDWLQLAISGWILGIGFYFWYPWNYHRSVIQSATALFHTRQIAEVAGRWEVVIGADGIRTNTPVTSNFTAWSCIGPVHKSDDGILIYLMSGQSVLHLPRRVFADQPQLDLVARLLRSRCR